MDERLLKSEEKAVFALRALYESYGYLPFKMSKFEEYDLYATNKEFLVSDRIITFNDTDGKLMALKPDVTLSIVKNSTFEKGEKRKVFYNENVYRVAESTNQFKEILQTGLECIGDVGEYEVFETVYLAAKSLEKIAENYALDVADMGLFAAVAEEVGADEKLKNKLLALIANKNRHDAYALCVNAGLSEDGAQKICTFIDAYGERESVLEKLAKVCTTEKSKKELERLSKLSALLSTCSLGDKIRFDFSVQGDATYYNGIVFKGFLQGIPEAVLSGGQYDKLLKRMGKKGGAIGFAIYLDLLEDLEKTRNDYDVDCLVLYDEETPILQVKTAVEERVQKGERVRAQSAKASVRYKEVLDLRKGK